MTVIGEDIESLISDLHKLYNDEETSDVVILVGPSNTKFCAHKIFLWSRFVSENLYWRKRMVRTSFTLIKHSFHLRCESFHKYALQFWRSKGGQGPLTFKYPQYDSTDFEQVLSYIYTGRVRLLMLPTYLWGVARNLCRKGAQLLKFWSKVKPPRQKKKIMNGERENFSK